MHWDDAERRLELRLDPDSRMPSAPALDFEVRVAGQDGTHTVRFSGEPVSVKL